MPKETVHWGKRYKLVKHEATETTGEWLEEFPWDGSYQEDGNGNTLPLPPDTQAARSPSLEVIWTRPDERAPVAYDEDPEGFVQVGMMIDMVDMKNYFRHDDLNDPDLVTKTFYTRGLTRTQINQMIRTLKRARDAAFGSDE